MKINEIFVKDLSRKINGVVKAEQRDPAVIWQELDEFVVTRELSKHIDSFFQTYLEFLENRMTMRPVPETGFGYQAFWVREIAFLKS